MSKESWRTFIEKMSEHWPIFTGDFTYANEILADKNSRSPWLILQFLNVLGRSFGQVIFANNPISGAIIVLAIGIADYMAMLTGIYSAFLGFSFALITRQDSNAILNGALGFNPVLHGVVSAGCLPLLYPDIKLDHFSFWILLTITTLISIYATSACNNLFSNLGKYPLPSFSLPFNVLQLILIYCLVNNNYFEKTVITEGYENYTASGNESSLNWGETFSGTILALSQVYGLKSLPCACLIYLALFVYSPLMTGFGYLGSLLGTLIGIFFATNYQEIYDGAWGYNALLCMAALSGFCFALNVQSSLIGLISVFFCTALHHSLQPLFLAMNLPIMTVPFNLTTILFLLITTEKEKTLVRPEILSFPEKHRRLYKEVSTDDHKGYF